MIIVSSLAAVPALVDEHKVSHVLSLLGPDTPHQSFRGIEDANHLKLTFHDIVEPLEGFTAPTPQDVERMIGFFEAWGRAEPMLIHCWAGISRSTAAAFTAMCLFHPRHDEEELAWQLRGHSRVATPNRRIVAFADDILNRSGRMLAAIERIGRGEDAYEGITIRWPLPALSQTVASLES